MVWYGVAGRVYSYVKTIHNGNTGLQKYAKYSRLKIDSGSRTRTARAARNDVLESLPNVSSF